MKARIMNNIKEIMGIILVVIFAMVGARYYMGSSENMKEQQATSSSWEN